MTTIKASFEPGQSTTGPKGQVAHPLNISHTARLERKLYEVGDRAWCMVGNGLSNQSFVEGPEGLIVIDTGESIEEMESALAEVRQFTQAPVAACIYTHFHYVAGTEALEKENPDLPIWGHSGIEANLRRFGGEVGPRSTRGLVHQFALGLPDEGPDGLVNVGLGLFFRNPDHAPFSRGYVPAQHTFDSPTTATIAGLEVDLYPAPSDATDSITIWFPERGIAVNNLLWPALFNVFAIRGEEYRDPRVLLSGLDQLGSLNADHLMGAHGPPISGPALIEDSIIRYRDSIQYLWDQTVRAANRGLTLDEIIEVVQLPESYADNYLTQQLYGVVEHHIRQIYTGLFGWFDEDEAKLFPTPAPERAQKLIAGFGGIENVRDAIDRALAETDLRWAVELATWLVRCERNESGRADAGAREDRQRLAAGLRGIAQSTTSANVRNWCLTRALNLEGSLDLDRYRQHRFSRGEVLSKAPGASVAVLRVLLDPNATAGVDDEVCFEFDDGSSAGLRIRHHVAVPTSGEDAGVTMQIDQQSWAELLACRTAIVTLLDKGSATTTDRKRLLSVLNCFDVASFKTSAVADG